jgi:hypothetical protein
MVIGARGGGIVHLKGRQEAENEDGSERPGITSSKIPSSSN